MENSGKTSHTGPKKGILAGLGPGRRPRKTILPCRLAGRPSPKEIMPCPRSLGPAKRIMPCRLAGGLASAGTGHGHSFGKKACQHDFWRRPLIPARDTRDTCFCGTPGDTRDTRDTRFLRDTGGHAEHAGHIELGDTAGHTRHIRLYGRKLNWNWN